MVTFLILGGPVLWLILLAGVIGLTVFLERYFHIHRAKIKTTDFLRGISNILDRGNIAESLAICEETPGPVAAITRAAIQQRQVNSGLVREAIDQAALAEIGRMEKKTQMLSVVAYLAPLLGLLGTVLGFIRILVIIQQKAPLLQASDLAEGMWQALLTSATGLGIAIAAVLGYSLIMTKIDVLALDMELSVSDILALTAPKQKNNEPEKNT